jgi:hypothetical protein
MPTKKKANPQKAGRPTKYLPKYCTQVIAWGKEGKSREWICANLDIVVQTMANWEAQHPEFLEAMELSLLQAQMWWEDAGQNGMTKDGPFNAAIWNRSMSARFPKSWRDKLEVTPGVPNFDHLTQQQRDELRTIAEATARLSSGGTKAV